MKEIMEDVIWIVQQQQTIPMQKHRVEHYNSQKCHGTIKMKLKNTSHLVYFHLSSVQVFSEGKSDQKRIKNTNANDLT